jgi:hypothetical protein
VERVSGSGHLCEVERRVKADDDDIDLVITIDTHPARDLHSLDHTRAGAHKHTLAMLDQTSCCHCRCDDGARRIDVDVGEFLLCLRNGERREIGHEKNSLTSSLKPVDRFRRAVYWLVREPDNAIEIQ